MTHVKNIWNPPTSLSQGGFFTTGDHDDALLQRSGVVWKERRFSPQKWWYHEILWDIQTSGSGFGISTNWQFWKADEGSIYLQNGSKWSILPTNMIRNPWSTWPKTEDAGNGVPSSPRSSTIVCGWVSFAHCNWRCYPLLFKHGSGIYYSIFLNGCVFLN